ncbi:serine/threonine-protein kinase [Streptomyces sp. GC420]|uniref:serine/threonine-protein kinase n=1 Tax=Streptomyces sp. GC420 TaxID=2697568 RepID=UPI0037D9BA69
MADRYRLDSPLGRGGMGEVWRATDEVLGRPVAVKLLIGDGDDSSAAARFRMEAQTAARLNHPNVVGVFDFGLWDNRFYLVMELVEGRSLAQELTAGGSLPAARVAALAAHAASGLAAAHRQGIVHRDVKPGNLLLDAEGTLKVGDFGIARFVDDPNAALTTAGQIVGTGLYLAPERALGRQAGPPSDVYSLGCVLYQLLAGRPPFEADTATALLYQHVDTPPVPPRQRGADLPPAFDAYLLSMLAKQPEERPAAQVVADWFASGAWQGRPEPLPAPAPDGSTQGGGRSHAARSAATGRARHGRAGRTSSSGTSPSAASPAGAPPASPGSGEQAALTTAPPAGAHAAAPAPAAPAGGMAGPGVAAQGGPGRRQAYGAGGHAAAATPPPPGSRRAARAAAQGRTGSLPAARVAPAATGQTPGPAPLADHGSAQPAYASQPGGRAAARRAAPAPSRGMDARAFIRRRPRVASAVAGAVAFLVALLIGLTMF